MIQITGGVNIMKKLAILGGEPVLTKKDEERIREITKWPIITEEDEEACLDVIRENNFSGTDITEKFEDEYKKWIGTDYAVAYCNGTMSLAAAMFAIGLGKGDEIICPTITYWASIVPATTFGATAVFCDVDDKLCIDPDDLERVISPKTKAVVVVHYSSNPADMDRIMEIARKYNLIVIEDVSHAQGGLYKGKRLGTFGDIAAMSLMSGKSFAAGELGILVTNNRKYYERALAYGHYDRNNEKYIKENEELFPYFRISLGGVKGRVNQLCAAMARVQLKYHDERCAEIRKAMNYLFDLLDGIPGFKPLRANEAERSNNAGFYAAYAKYDPKEFHGLTASAFADAIKAELGNMPGFEIGSGSNYCLHAHNFFKTFDFNHSGEPSRTFGQSRDVRELDEKLESTFEKQKNVILCPWIKKYDKEMIEKIAKGIRNVVENHEQLLEIHNDGPEGSGRWYGFNNH